MNTYVVSFLSISSWWAGIKDAMATAAVNTVIGLAVVFIALVVISYIISLFKYISIAENKLKNRKNKKASAPSVENVEETYEDVTDDLELVAVITAAISAYSSEDRDFVVRSIKKINKNAWQKA